MDKSWGNHYKKVEQKNLLPSATLEIAMDLFDKEKTDFKTACDLGFGNGIDTIALIKNGWQVTAIDNQTQAIEKLKSTISEKDKTKLTLINENFEAIKLPNVLLVNASFSLPFCKPENFDALWQKIAESILPNGRFAGHFFGVNDSWAFDPEKTFLTKEQILNLFKDFDLEYFEEVQKTGKSIDGKDKNWHVFHVVSKKVL